MRAWKFSKPIRVWLSQKSVFFLFWNIQVDTSIYKHSNNKCLLWGLQIHCQNSIFRKRILTVRIDWSYLGNIFEFPFWMYACVYVYVCVSNKSSIHSKFKTAGTNWFNLVQTSSNWFVADQHLNFWMSKFFLIFF